jgi:hypothetical protein
MQNVRFAVTILKKAKKLSATSILAALFIVWFATSVQAYKAANLDSVIAL